MPRELEYKPLLYTTTIRNPERYKDFMHILKRFVEKFLMIVRLSYLKEICLRLGYTDQ